jgi:integrase
MPALFRTLYACGLRIGEALTLTVADADLEAGLLTIRPENAKFNKGRTLPMSETLVARLADYDAKVGVRGPTAPFFPSPRGFYRPQPIGNVFRGLLAAAEIPHTDDGPTIHSLRHTFACHCIMRWAREGANVNANLPFLSAYLGHEGLRGTERYLRFTAEMMPELREAVERLSWVIPGSGREEPS